MLLTKGGSVLKLISQLRGGCVNGIIYRHLQGLRYKSGLFNSWPFLGTELTPVQREELEAYKKDIGTSVC